MRMWRDRAAYRLPHALTAHTPPYPYLPYTQPLPTQAGLLLEHEARAIAPLPSKAQVVWAWQAHFWSRACTGELGNTKPAQPGQVYGIAMSECMAARSAIATGIAYVDTQMPFP